MYIFAVEQLKCFGLAVAFGLGICAAYELIRIFRRAIHHNIVAISVEDVLFVLAAALFSCIFFFRSYEGMPRFYHIIGMILGIFVWQFFCGRYIVKFLGNCLRKILVKLTNLLKKNYKWFKIVLSRRKKAYNVTRGGNIDEKQKK